VDHAIAAGDLSQAANLVERVAWETLAQGEMLTLLRWLDALPRDLVRALPGLCVLNAWALALTGKFDGVEPCLLGIDPGQVEGEVAAVRAYVADVHQDLQQAIAYAHKALELLPEENLFLRSIVALIVGTGAYRTGGDPQAASRALGEAATLG
jgi:LuxR family maltose regulon positive regulatory protein